MTRTPRNILATDALANIEGYVTQAQQHGGGWVQLVFHNICNQCDTYAITKSDLAALLDWLATQNNTTTATVQQVIGGPLRPAVNGPAPVNLPGPNLLHNPSLEEEARTARCRVGWDTTSYGTNTATCTRTTDAHSGSYAERLDVTNFQSGAARLLSHLDQGQYAPTPTVGDNYDVGAYYKSTVPVQLLRLHARPERRVELLDHSGFAAGLLELERRRRSPRRRSPAGSRAQRRAGHPAGRLGDDGRLQPRRPGRDPAADQRAAEPRPGDAVPAGVPVCWSPVIGGGCQPDGNVGEHHRCAQRHERRAGLRQLIHLRRHEADLPAGRHAGEPDAHLGDRFIRRRPAGGRQLLLRDHGHDQIR